MIGSVVAGVAGNLFCMEIVAVGDLPVLIYAIYIIFLLNFSYVDLCEYDFRVIRLMRYQ